MEDEVISLAKLPEAQFIGSVHNLKCPVINLAISEWEVVDAHSTRRLGIERQRLSSNRRLEFEVVAITYTCVSSGACT